MTFPMPVRESYVPVVISSALWGITKTLPN